MIRYQHKLMQYLDVNNEGLPLCLVLKREVEGPQTTFLLLSLGPVHSRGGCLAGQSAGWRRQIVAVRHTGLGEPRMGRGQLQVWRAPHLLVMVMERFGGEVAVQIALLKIKMHGRSGAVWARCQFVGTRRTHWRGLAVSVDVGFAAVGGCWGGGGCELLLAAQAFWVDVNPFQHVHKLVRRSLLGLGVFALTTDPGES